ncbi:GNAT family N-acetyltransferase [Halobaculum sp. WSA2]|uniref:GNAT family N-acetyltransferase n=1 Tax=Halobaculum saliterrae TaxID=2073113 RepID=A0A6B0T9U7_9EURY|nr:GNAT family N-acetyltransferase [Halobaculum saliterrae]MXR43319.1 GNAT family N-acetyltransferase [Halobaculum saliterrae]
MDDDEDPADGNFAPARADWTATVAATESDWEAVVDLRMRVFVDEQGVPEHLELDEHDEDPLDSDVDHLLVRDTARGGEAVATARLRAVDADDYGALDAGTERVAKVERVVVARDRRGEGWGARVMGAVEDRARGRGLAEAVLHAQTHAAGFYERLDYAVDDALGTFDEDGIEHVRMRRRL